MFVTDNYNLDTQWLRSIDQPLLNEAANWSEHAAYLRALGGTTYNEQAIEFNEGANLALQIAGEAPASRGDKQVTITNQANGGASTEITVFANGSGLSVNDVSQSIGQTIWAGLVQGLTDSSSSFSAAQLPFLALSFDDGDTGPDTTGSQDEQTAISLADAVMHGIDTGPSPETPTAELQILDTQAVGGLYGIVQTAQTGNAAGVLAAALQAEAAGAAGLDSDGGGQGTLTKIEQDLGTIAAGTSMAGDFNGGNLGQGLVDSLNGYLSAEVQADVNALNDADATLNWAAFNLQVTPVSAGGLTSPTSPVSGGAAGGVVTLDGITYAVTVSAAQSADENATTTPESEYVQAVSSLQSTVGPYVYPFLDNLVPPETNARNMKPQEEAVLDNNGNVILDLAQKPTMMPVNANPSAVPDIGNDLYQAALLGGEGSSTLVQLQLANLALFRQGGAWDFQRIGPSLTFISDFSDYANFEIGAYAAAINLPMTEILQTANIYAGQYSKFGPADPPDAVYTNLPAAKVYDIKLGYIDYQSGLIGHH